MIRVPCVVCTQGFPLPVTSRLLIDAARRRSPSVGLISAGADTLGSVESGVAQQRFFPRRAWKNDGVHGSLSGACRRDCVTWLLRACVCAEHRGVPQSCPTADITMYYLPPPSFFFFIGDSFSSIGKEKETLCAPCVRVGSPFFPEARSSNALIHPERELLWH